jgi:hypothetical protein
MTRPTYEMLWDCKFCGTRKLLGLTHRHCPNCGAPQNAQQRYFPSDAEKVAVQDHVYHGADVICAHCSQANSKNSKHCGGCGTLLEGLPEVARRQDQVARDGIGFAQPASADARSPAHAAAPPVARRTARHRVLFLGIAGLAIVLLVVVLNWTKSAALVVTGHTWQRGITIERLGPVRDSAWCDSLPRDARNLSQRREVRTQRRVPDGEDCGIRRADNGDGTFSEHRECSPRYRSEDVYDDRCTFTVDRWTKVRDAAASGTSIETLRWPATNLARSGSCIGCEREGRRTESFTVRFADATAGERTCRFSAARWRSIAEGSRWKGQIRVVGNSLDCKSLVAE